MPRGACVIRREGARGVVWYVKYRDADGRQVKERLGPEPEWTERLARAELRERLVRVERKGYRRPKPIAFAEYADTWLEEGQRRRAWRPGTVRMYRVAVGRLKDWFGPMRLGAVRPRHVAAYVSEMTETYAAATITRDLSILHDVFETALREELVDSNPAHRAERPKARRRSWRILEPIEVARVAKAFKDEQARAVFLTLVLTGVRSGELRAFRWRDVNLVEGVLRVRDSKSEEGVRAIALSPGLQEQLWQHRRRSSFQGDDERVFCHPRTGGPYHPETFRDALNAALKAAGIDDYVRPFHDLRHTAITNDAASGASPIAVMAKAGHANMATTKRYMHLAGVVFREEAEALERRLLGGAATPRRGKSRLSR